MNNLLVIYDTQNDITIEAKNMYELYMYYMVL
jgi:hypothetical protein